MKTFFTLTFLAFFTIQAACQFQPKLPNWYASGYVGGFLAGEEISATVNLSAGFQYNKWLGAGISYGSHFNGYCNNAGFSGVGLDYRLLFPGKWVWNFTGGIGFRSSINCDGMYMEYRNPKRNFPFFKVHAGRRIGKAFTIGSTIWLANTTMDVWIGDEDANGQLVYSFRRKKKIDLSGFAITLGFNIH